ncbi:ABC transporter ATP-binding protein [Flavihumibacter sp. CACIAM 22H1]|uniref:ABC transporter ATP-binding protein n=1 Tax=Flavihumibacter sp. CACIAM 22H1 TaxID=1812911 RepID=UPI0007A92268|nr:ABC transporter ATP-binding protein [Flavihumibacter sp. CACIAM 22H1]KYP14104.1 MAG: multidrug ABC transporter ATP-binding protein [Flavihumibacter sp. CACIAM 22H1]
MPTLTIQQLSKTYPNGIQALHAINLSISPGLFGLLGPNGAGKSSLMKIIAGLEPASSGTIFFNEKNILADPLYIKQRLGFLPQDFGVYPTYSAMDLLNYLAVLKGLPKAGRKEQVLALLHKVNLYDKRKQEVASFSGGMRQRFGIAQALLGNPELILVDEPTAGLDPEERNRFNNLLSELGEQIIVVLSTHIVEDVKSLCPHMAILIKGQLVAQGSTHQFIETIQGKIWKKTIHKKDLPAYQARFAVLYTQLNAGQLNIRVVSDQLPGPGFDPAEPLLEDIYFANLLNTSTHA